MESETKYITLQIPVIKRDVSEVLQDFMREIREMSERKSISVHEVAGAALWLYFQLEGGCK